MSVWFRLFFGLIAATLGYGCDLVPLKILAINDFHGQISQGKIVQDRPVGGAAVLSAYLKAAMANKKQQTIIISAGDLVGASPASSALLQDEPAITFFNSFANEFCQFPSQLTTTNTPSTLQLFYGNHFVSVFDQRCNLLAVPGNHEFDDGQSELLRLFAGGNHKNGPFLENPWRGARFPMIAANIHLTDGRSLFKPFVIKNVAGEKIAFIGAVTRDTPNIVTSESVAGLKFSSESKAINAQVQKLQEMDIHAIVAVIHEGGTGSAAYESQTQNKPAHLSRFFVNLVNQLDADVDVVISAHSHNFTNTLLKNAGGHEVLVTQAFSSGKAFADIDIAIDPNSHDIVKKTARIVTTWGDAGPGLTPDVKMAEFVKIAEAKVAPIANKIIATTNKKISRKANQAGESILGDMIAEAHRQAMQANFGITNVGGLRSDIPNACNTKPCNITWNDCFTAQPFSNTVTTMTLTGQQIYDLLEQQWLNQSSPRLLQIAGFSYSWSQQAAKGKKVVPNSIKALDGTPINKSATYSVAVNSFLGAGSDAFTVFKKGKIIKIGILDLDALIKFLANQPQPIKPKNAKRIIKIP
ncbi:MAG: 5'-nucleotidase C-terminal domain-containing protein [Deltaproteobacteria bacterium]|nr:5'-nucleotidase C-terminal domain-containing protein [Deltaproteobacteria bacterium]